MLKCLKHSIQHVAVYVANWFGHRAFVNYKQILWDKPISTCEHRHT